jgi:CheY-like chemotaxis protein
MALCPACEQENADQAQTCSACGTPLVMRCPACDTINVRTRTVCHRCKSALRPASADDDALVEDRSPAAADTEPAVLLTLRADALDGREPAYWRDHAPPPAPPGMPEARPWMAGTDHDTLAWPALDAAAPPGAADAAGPGGETAPAAGPGPVAPPEPAAPSPFQRAKAERRAKVRQRQLRTRRDRAMPSTAPPIDILLLEPDAASRTLIASVLEDFGFRIHMVVDTADVAAMSVQRRHAAVLLGLGAPDLDTASLCRQLRRLPAFGATPVFAIGDPGRHAERVRMQLAGAQDTLMRPLTRGALAQTLDRHGVVLPRDPRVGGPPSD